MKAAVFVALLLAFVNSISAMSHFEKMDELKDIDADLEIELHGIESSNFFYERQAEHGLQVGATYGVDYSTIFSASTASCLKSQGFNFAIPRGYMSVGRVDPNLAANVRNARAGGISYVDTYFFPCPKCGNAANQWAQLVNYVGANKLNVGMVWLDIEGAQYWLGNAIANRNFYESLLAAAVRSGWKLGIYSSLYTWNEIFGTGYTKGGNYPLWYAHYDNWASFGDFRPFGGFSRPTIKQYIGDTVRCGGGVDINFY